MKIVQYGAGVIHVFGRPLALRDQYPVQRLAGTALEGGAEEDLCMPQKRDVRAAQAQLLPQHPHQAVRLRTASGIAMPARDKQQAGALRRNLAGGERTHGYIGEALHYKRMAGIGVVVENLHMSVAAPELGQGVAEPLALPEVPIERCGQHENLGGAIRGHLVQQCPEAALARIFRGMHRQRGEAYSRHESENTRGGFRQ